MSKPGTGASESLPLKWRPRPPGPQSAGTVFQFVREYLCRHGGSPSRTALLKAIQAEPRLGSRLEQSRGFERVLANMRYSGWVELSGETVTATAKTRRRALV